MFLLRCVSKLFFKDGSGDPLLTATYILHCCEGMDKIPILNFRGNRFNVLFYNAAGTYVLRPYITQYLSSSKSSLNYVQSSILEFLQNSIILSILRALGIISKIITEPYWKFAECRGMSALEMGPIYVRLIELLQECGSDATQLLRNNVRLFPGPPVHGTIYDILFNIQSDDSAVKEILQIFCRSLCVKCQSLFKEFINDGKYNNPTSEIQRMAESCPTDNICVERLMAKVDSKLKQTPTLNTNSLESVVIYKNNETSEWLRKQDDGKKDEIITKAMKSTKEYSKLVKSRKKSLIESHLSIIREKQQQVKEKKERERRKIEKCKGSYKNSWILVIGGGNRICD